MRIIILLLLAYTCNAQVIQTEYYTVYEGTTTRTEIIQDTIDFNDLEYYEYELDTLSVSVNTIDEFDIWNTTNAWRITISLPSDWSYDHYTDFTPKAYFIDPETGIEITNIESWTRR